MNESGILVKIPINRDVLDIDEKSIYVPIELVI